jgi:carbon-monoxide dehydrogenase medium subunit
MYAFEYLKPTSLKEAKAMLAKNPDGKFLSGGHTLLPAMKLRLAGPSALIDLSGVDGMRGIERKGDMIVIGAFMTHREVANSDVLKAAIPTLAEMVGTIGDPAVRTGERSAGQSPTTILRPTTPPAPWRSGATIVTDSRRVAADDSLPGFSPRRWPRARSLPRSSSRSRSGWGTRISATRPPAMPCAPSRSRRTASGEMRVAVIGAGSEGVFRMTEMENALKASFSADAIKSIKVPTDDMASDIHADQEYRAHLVGVMARRAVAAAK